MVGASIPLGHAYHTILVARQLLSFRSGLLVLKWIPTTESRITRIAVGGMQRQRSVIVSETLLQ